MKSTAKNKSLVSNETALIADMITEEYRFCKSYNSLVNKLFQEERQKYVSIMNYHFGKMMDFSERANMKIVSFEGKLYDEGLPVVGLNISDFDKDDLLIVEQTIEPTIIDNTSGQVIKNGSAIFCKSLD